MYECIKFDFKETMIVTTGLKGRPFLRLAHIVTITISAIKMKLLQIILTLCYFSNASGGRKTHPGRKGNMRGTITIFSGFTPREIKMIKRILEAESNSKYGRFA